jgi:gliding motility-associated-like protein
MEGQANIEYLCFIFIKNSKFVRWQLKNNYLSHESQALPFLRLISLTFFDMIFSLLRIQVTLLFLFFVASGAVSQATFQKYMTISDSLSNGYCVAGLKNGNIAVGGEYAKNLTSGNTNAVVFMLNEFGENLWSLKLGEDNTGELISDMEGLIDGGLLVSYASYANNDLNFTSMLRINNLGAIVWSKKLAFNTDVFGMNITAVTGGFILNGYSGAGNSSTLTKIDLSGNIIWTRIYSEIAIGNTGISEDNAGNIHIAGRLSGQGVWAKLNGSNGALLNARTYDSPHFFAFEVCKVIQNDSLLLIGTDFTSNFVLLKTDLNGNPGSIARYNYGTATLNPLSVQSSGDGAFVLSVYQESGSNQAGILAHFSSNLNVDWAKTYANSNGHLSYFLDMDDDATGYVICGTYNLDNKERALLVKTDLAGNISGKCCPKNIDLVKTPASVSLNNSPNLIDSGLALLENFSVTGSFFSSEPTPICVTNEKINASDTLICPGQCITLLLGDPEQGINYSWNLMGGTPPSSTSVNPGTVCYNTEGSYPIKLSADDCLLDSVSLTVDTPTDNFPNAFSPNGDSNNDVYRLLPLFKCPVEEYRLQIFNRWGDLLFETYNQNEGWNGEANGEPAPVDVYICRVEFFAVRNGVRTLVFNQKKEVTLVR